MFSLKNYQDAVYNTDAHFYVLEKLTIIFDYVMKV
jgi:hypothetical protein